MMLEKRAIREVSPINIPNEKRKQNIDYDVSEETVSFTWRAPA